MCLMNDFDMNDKDIEGKIEKMLNDWNKVKCAICGSSIDLLTCSYEDGEPVCKDGCYVN